MLSVIFLQMLVWNMHKKFPNLNRRRRRRISDRLKIILMYLYLSELSRSLLILGCVVLLLEQQFACVSYYRFWVVTLQGSDGIACASYM